VNDLDVAQIPEPARELKGQRDELVDGERPEPANGRRQRRPLEMLHHHMRSSAVQGRAEPPDEDRVSEPPEQARLPREPPQDAFVLDEVRSDELRDDERREAFVPSEKGLILVAASQFFQRESAGDDLLALLEDPRTRLAPAAAAGRCSR
jgi:hypothetical protein